MIDYSQFSDEVKDIVKRLFSKDVKYSNRYSDRTVEAKDFEIKSVEYIPQYRCYDITVDVTEEIDADDFEHDLRNNSAYFTGSVAIELAKRKMYRYLVNSGQICYSDDYKTNRYEFSNCQQWKIKDARASLLIYVEPRYRGGSDYFSFDDDLFDRRYCRDDINSPKIINIGSDDDEPEFSINEVKCPVILTLKYY